MVRIVVDPAVCQLHGQCVDRAPELFQFGDGEVVEHVPSAVGDEAEAARDAEFLCPVQAISVTE
jgi:ferredoxin